MEQSLTQSEVLAGTKSASVRYRRATVNTSKSLSGETEAKGLTHRAGLMMLSIARWLEQEKSFEITGVAILLSLFVLALCLWITTHTRHRIAFEGSYYEIIGMAQINDKGRMIYTPVYEVKK